jgi:hypothetical protein
MITLNETLHAGGFVLSGNFDGSNISVDKIIVASGQTPINAGTVLGLVTTTGKYVQVNESASDGSQHAVAILWDYTDATSADAVAAAVTRYEEVTGGELTWPAGISGPQKVTNTAELAAVGIIVR